MNVINLDSPNHILHHILPTNIHAPNRTNLAQRIHNTRLALRLRRPQKPNQTDNPFKADALEALLQRARTADFEDVIDAFAVPRQLARCLAPVGVGFVVDDVVGAQGLEFFGFLRARGCCDDGCAGGFGELYYILHQHLPG